ncbi:MAG: DUF2085 domain-containing protein [Anaerolineae bacterium]|nr:MAG: DUF2085 domain-containing protein [Anaerolineae bacterium]
MQKRNAKLSLQVSRWLIPLAALIVLIGWLSFTPPGILGKADAIGYAVCHRIGVRSFHIGTRQLPMCARDTGTFTGAALVLLIQAIIGHKRAGMPRKSILVLMGVLAAAWGLDGSNSYLYLIKQTTPGFLDHIPNLYTPNNTLRLLTGSGMGLAMASILFPLFNQTVWRTPDPLPVLNKWKRVGALIAVLLLMDMGVLSGLPVILYPVALISAGGVMVMLTLIFAVLWVTLMGQENAYETLPQLWLPLLAGFTLALILITAIDLFRLRATGTWEGFSIGQ